MTAVLLRALWPKNGDNCAGADSCLAPYLTWHWLRLPWETCMTGSLFRRPRNSLRVSARGSSPLVHTDDDSGALPANAAEDQAGWEFRSSIATYH